MSDLLEMLFTYNTESYILDTYHLFISITYTLVVSGFMFMIYKSIHTALSYNKKFGITLVMLSIVSTILLALIQNNPLLSLGVLGSLSICRIRTNTRDPRDIGFVFWSLAIGIASAVGAFSIGIIGSLVLGIFLYISFNFKKDSNTLLMIIRGNKEHLNLVQETMRNSYGSSVQCKNIFTDHYELVYELHLGQNEEEILVNKISEIDGVSGVNILAPETKVV